MAFIRKLMKNEKGATAIEYGLIAALIAVAAISAMNALGGSLSTTFQGVSNELDTAIASSNV
jgi:pilus assembly protein Flp/PilA